MSRRPRKTTRGLPVRKRSLRAPTELPDDTEKLVSSSMRDGEADPPHRHTRPELPLVSQPVPHRDYSAHEIADVPAPIPDTGLPPLSPDSTTLTTWPLSTSQTSDTSKVTPTRSRPVSKPTFVPLPYLKTENLTEIEEAAARSSSTIPPTPSIRPTSDPCRNPQPNTRFSTPGIIALAVGSSLVFFIAIVLVKLVKRPRRQRAPTPSLPILHDGIFPHDKQESEGSPIFGGKECLSPTLQTRGMKENTGLWTWTQYNSGIPKPAPTVTVTRPSSRDQLLNISQANTSQATQQDSFGGADSDGTCAQGQNRGQYPLAGYGASNAISKGKSPIALQPVQNAITRTVSRLSTVSISLYPNPPLAGVYSQVEANVGLALGGAAHSGAQANVGGSKYRDRMMASRNRTSMLTPIGSKDEAGLRRSQGFACGGMEPTSPSIVSPSKEQLNGGRARVKSTYYTPGSYPRAPAAAVTNQGKHEVDDEHEGINQEENNVDSRLGRELTSTLGLISTIPPSPQPTLYPDDSMSVIGEAKKVTVTGRSQKKPVPKASCDSPSTDAVGLMMEDFAAPKSTASPVNIRPRAEQRVEDKPPRVPSPPPIPSLAQMALQHDAEYHSPTYSIYGLYDGDRKGRGLS